MKPSLFLDFNDTRLKYLYVSHQLGSMRAAADELGLAPSSVSRQISLLEAELRIDLVEAGTHRIRLTEAGDATVEYYRKRALQHEELLGRLNELRGSSLCKTIVAVGEGLFGIELIRQLEAFFQSHPNSHTEIVIAPSNDVQRMIIDDAAHVGVVFAPYASTRLRQQFAIKQPLRAIVHPDNALVAQGYVTLQDLASEALVLPGPNYRVRELIREACRGQPFSIEPSITSNSLQVITDFVRANIASTLLAELPMLAEIRAGNVVALPIRSVEMSSTELQVVTRQSRKLSPVSKELIHYLARAINQVRRSSSTDTQVPSDSV